MNAINVRGNVAYGAVGCCSCWYVPVWKNNVMSVRMSQSRGGAMPVCLVSCFFCCEVFLCLFVEILFYTRQHYFRFVRVIAGWGGWGWLQALSWSLGYIHVVLHTE